MKHIVGIYIRMQLDEIERLRQNPTILPKYDPRVALRDGRGYDIGRAWEELGVFLDGGIELPESGPTVGEELMPNTDERATWSYVIPDRVVVMADSLKDLTHRDFVERYRVDQEDTQPIPGMSTGEFGDRTKYLFWKLRKLANHYVEAAANGEGMLVRIGERI